METSTSLVIHHHLVNTLCHSKEHLIVSPLIAALPFWFRLLQCARRFYDTGPCAQESVGGCGVQNMRMLYHFVIKHVNPKHRYCFGGCSTVLQHWIATEYLLYCIRPTLGAQNGI